MNIMDYRKIEDEFITACQARGLMVQGRPKFDGSWHRVKVEGDKGSQASGAYRVFLDGLPAGSIFNHKKGIQDTWVTGHNINDEDLKKLRDSSEKNKLDQAQKIKQQQELMSKVAQHVVNNSPPASDSHQYLKNKQVPSFGLKVVTQNIANEKVLVGRNFKESKLLREQNPNKVVLTQNDLIIPLQDMKNKTWSFQTISAYGFKSYLKYAKKVECGHVFGQLENGKPILVGEGFSTMGTVIMATNKTAAVSVCDCSNLPYVCNSLRETYPDSKIYIMADNDWEAALKDPLNKNPGLDSAYATAEQVKDTYVLSPKFPEGATDCSDWNDLHVKFGLKEVTDQIRSQLYVIKDKLESHVKEINHTVHGMTGSSTYAISGKQQHLQENATPVKNRN